VAGKFENLEKTLGPKEGGSLKDAGWSTIRAKFEKGVHISEGIRYIKQKVGDFKKITWDVEKTTEERTASSDEI